MILYHLGIGRRINIPITGSGLLHSPDSIPRISNTSFSFEDHHKGIIPEIPNDATLRPEASEMVELFKAKQQQAQEALQLGQYFQK